jgi:exopolysaccharide biosynthesis polyprenyl glycosylphosphotransferase
LSLSVVQGRPVPSPHVTQPAGLGEVGANASYAGPQPAISMGPPHGDGVGPVAAGRHAFPGVGQLVRPSPLAASRLRGDGTVARRRWRTRYVASIVAGDAACALLAGVAGLLVRFGYDPLSGSGPMHAAIVTAALPFVWTAAMYAARSYEHRFLCVGADEFRRVLTASAWVLTAFGTTSWAFKWDLARGFVVVALPMATLLTLVQRYARRQALHRQRISGRHRETTLVVGHRSGVAALHRQIAANRYQGLDVIGCCLPASQAYHGGTFGGLPVLGSLNEVIDVVHQYEVDVVAVLPSPELEGPALRRLGWDLEETAADLLLAPAVTEIAGPRVAIRPLAGLPLLHVERPELTGTRRAVKALFDVSVALLGLLLLSPVLLVISAAIGLTSRGPVLYKQTRVGRDGKTFGMLKFRSMVIHADRRLVELQASSDGNGVLFKMRNDPRVTRVGRILRRYSLDELPQLINVVLGQMSLVGPRPPLPQETERYGSDMRRRFLVKPGMTGLWQISGRSDLSWDDSVRIDVRYVENWSFWMDLFILWKTIGAVRGGSGAY